MNEEAARAALANAGVLIPIEEPIKSIMEMSKVLAITLERGTLVLRRGKDNTWTVAVPLGQEFPRADQFKA